MAVTAGRAWNSQTVATATNTQALSGLQGVREFVIGCDAGSAVGLRVNVRNRVAEQSIHPIYSASNAITYRTIPAGTSMSFAASIDNPINSIIVDGDGGTATFSGSVTVV